MRTAIVLFLINLIVFSANASAGGVVNLGTHGKTYPIVENNFHEWLMSRIRSQKDKIPSLDENFLRKKLAKKMQVKDFGIPKCTDNKTKTVDPTYILDHNITDSSGNILYSKGTVVNPFDYINFKRKYFFLDVDNSTHIQLYKKLLASSDKPIQPLAVSGNLQRYYQKAKSLNMPIPAGKANKKMIKRMNITCVPALAYQDSKVLKIKEFILGDNNEKNQ